MSAVNFTLNFLNNPSNLTCFRSASCFSATVAFSCPGYMAITTTVLSILSLAASIAGNYLLEKEYEKLSYYAANLMQFSYLGSVAFSFLTFAVACYNLSFTAIILFASILSHLVFFFDLIPDESKNSVEDANMRYWYCLVNILALALTLILLVGSKFII